jgi:hypothetical protein
MSDDRRLEIEKLAKFLQYADNMKQLPEVLTLALSDKNIDKIKQLNEKVGEALRELDL